MTKNSHVLYFDNHYVAPVMVRGEGPYLYDEDGKRYLETCGGSISNSLAYGREDMAQVIGDQARQLSFAYNAHMDSAVQHEAADAMAEAFPALDRFFFCSGGSEATEIATKLARLHFYHSGKPEKNKIIGRWMSYHGYTEGALAYGGHPSRRKEFTEILREDGHIPPAYCYRCWYGKNCDICSMECAWALEEEILKADPDNVAAFIAEPVVGTALSGVPAPDGYFRIIRDICDKYNVLMIVDEVMCGTGRTGTMSCIEQYGVEPDIIALAKSLGGSYFPVGAVGMKEHVAGPIMDDGIFPVLHTWTGSPMACAVIKKTLDTIKSEKLLDNVNKVGKYLMEQLLALKERNPYIGDVRGKGMMIGLEFVKDKSSGEPFPPKMRLGEKLYQQGIENGLILMECMGIDHGRQGDALLFGPCFEFTETHVDELIRLLDKTISEVI
ncbi:MAG: aminotransferase class III-fold pyridoxal phosphate-dependent enzyme [Bacillota bacterium]|nr:aminotransferase class III-fold pyridoxal phosphate-dependent enzyme [Bacillota bacterium]